MRPKLAAAVIIVGITALPACSEASKVTTSRAPTAQAAPNPRIAVKPPVGRSHTRFVVSFTAPQGTRAPLRTGKAGGYLRYLVSARTAARHGCVWSGFANLAAPRNGARLSAKLIVRVGAWCVGTYRGKIIETFRPPCPPGELCPAFIGVIRTIGTFTFRVKPGSGAPTMSH